MSNSPQVEPERPPQPLEAERHPAGAVPVGGVHLGGADAGAVDPLLKKMRLAGHARPPQGREPVSYTHLDVYKRQLHGSVSRPAARFC